MRALVLVVAAGGIAACGSSSGGADARGGDAAAPRYDFNCGDGSACLLSDVCCSLPGGSASFECTATASCAAADQLTCAGPDDCGSAAPTCCGVEVGDGSGDYPSSCGLTSLGTSCTATAACATHLAASCSDTSTVQLCLKMSDCTDPDDPECCTFGSGSAQITFCIDSATAQLAGATCHQ